MFTYLYLMLTVKSLSPFKKHPSGCLYLWQSDYAHVNPFITVLPRGRHECLSIFPSINQSKYPHVYLSQPISVVSYRSTIFSVFRTSKGSSEYKAIPGSHKHALPSGLLWHTLLQWHYLFKAVEVSVYCEWVRVNWHFSVFILAGCVNTVCMWKLQNSG